MRQVLHEEDHESISSRVDTLSAMDEPETAKFMQEYMELCRRHGMAIVPCYTGNNATQIDFHDSMMVTTLQDPKEPDFQKSWEEFMAFTKVVIRS